MRRAAIVLIGLSFFPACVRAQDALPELRQAFDRASASGTLAGEFDSLAGRVMALAAGAGSRSRFWDAMGLVAGLCRSGPAERAHELRRDALTLLEQRFTDTGRWSSLIVAQFAPNLALVTEETWRHEIELYDALLDDLYASTTNDRVKAELLYAKAMVRVQITRHRDWLSPEDRRAAVALLEQIQELFGPLRVPGVRGQAPLSVGDRAAAHEYELTNLYFNAPAPPTSATDLDGDPLDLGAYAGNVVLLDFWTSFCVPCLAMVPDTRRLLEDLDGEPVVYLGVNGDSSREQERTTASRVGMQWRSFWDGLPTGPEGPIATAWVVRGWPSLFVIDGEGRVRHKLYGKEQIDAELRPAVEALLAEIGDAP